MTCKFKDAHAPSDIQRVKRIFAYYCRKLFINMRTVVLSLLNRGTKKSLASFAKTSNTYSSRYFVSRNMITVGTDLTKDTELSWQQARPWHMDGTSNLAEDNAKQMTDIFSKKTVVVFGVPAPFTGTCTEEHYPGYKKLVDEFLTEGVDEVVCYTVSDPYAHYGWGKALSNDFEKISFVTDDGNASWAKKHKLDRDFSGASLGIRSDRFSMLVKDGVVKTFHIVKDAVKDAETVLEEVKQHSS